MREIITEKLREIEKNENIRILYAAESGSRAWGFASPDSDYDVRFIYVRQENEYLRLDPVRDVLEYPISGELDINGWDIKKALQLLYRSNPSLFEWFSSPLVYIETEFSGYFRTFIRDYFSSKKGLYHYISMAENNYREFLHGPVVKVKKYFYVLRPLLAAKWIIDKGVAPPIEFSELVNTELDIRLIPIVEELLTLKKSHPEMKNIQRIDILNDYLERITHEVKEKLRTMSDGYENSWYSLNYLFRKVISEEQFQETTGI